MPGMNITVDGGNDVKAALSRLTGRMNTTLAEAVQAEAEAVADDERSSVPVRTGELRSGIQVRSTGALSAEVGIFDEALIYAIWIEWGRSRASAQPFATPAAEQSRQRWPSRAAQAGKEAAGG